MAILATLDDSVRAGLDWKKQLSNAVRNPVELAQRLQLPKPTQLQIQAAKQFPVFATESYLSRIEIGNPDDPLLRQILPLDEEMAPVDGFSTDPLLEGDAKLADGILQKYHGRVLLIVSPVCAIHCRYCFRRHFPYQESPKSEQQWTAAIAAIEKDHSIEEVILSGGDPLTLVDDKLQNLINQVDQIRHIRRIRIHTRLPIVLPARITSTLCKILQSAKSKVVVVVHTNHANELNDEVGEALTRLAQANCMLLNQSVLLKGVNDNLKSLVDLSKRLLDFGTTPYYLHQLDQVAGAAHFDLPIEVGKELVSQMREVLPGYAVPRFAIEKPGKKSKTVIA